ncbi:LysR family transcriptional regulator [Isoptericola halotolerans]|uniref:LysR family transcriptional regulator n=1 Tax=Isoptericola halotolerans TaxID=300560 RepID=UPI00388F0AC1
MGLIHLLAFVAVAHYESVSGAAEALGYSTSAVSRQIGALEQVLGVTLFDRGSSSMRLTSRGGALLPAAEQVLDALRSMSLHCGAATTVRTGSARPCGKSAGQGPIRKQ